MLTAVAIGIYAIAVSMWPLWYTTVAGTAATWSVGCSTSSSSVGTSCWPWRPSTGSPSPPPGTSARWPCLRLPDGVWVSADPASSVGRGDPPARLCGDLREREHPTWFAVFGVLVGCSDRDRARAQPAALLGARAPVRAVGHRSADGAVQPPSLPGSARRRARSGRALLRGAGRRRVRLG